MERSYEISAENCGQLNRKESCEGCYIHSLAREYAEEFNDLSEVASKLIEASATGCPDEARMDIDGLGIKVNLPPPMPTVSNEITFSLDSIRNLKGVNEYE